MMFPHPQRCRHCGGPVTHHLAAYWFKEAFERGKIVKPARSLWHMFRRVWATERKEVPLKDLAAASGWRDTTTLLRYQQPDESTLRAVVASSSDPRAALRGASRGAVILTHILAHPRR